LFDKRSDNFIHGVEQERLGVTNVSDVAPHLIDHLLSGDSYLGPKKPSHVLLERGLVQLVHEELLARLEHVLIQRLFVVLTTAVPQDLLKDTRWALRVVHPQLNSDRVGDEMPEFLSSVLTTFFFAARQPGIQQL
jgi:hypothetical protein